MGQTTQLCMSNNPTHAEGAGKGSSFSRE